MRVIVCDNCREDIPVGGTVFVLVAAKATVTADGDTTSVPAMRQPWYSNHAKAYHVCDRCVRRRRTLVRAHGSHVDYDRLFTVIRERTRRSAKRPKRTSAPAGTDRGIVLTERA